MIQVLSPGLLGATREMKFESRVKKQSL